MENTVLGQRVGCCDQPRSGLMGGRGCRELPESPGKSRVHQDPGMSMPDCRKTSNAKREQHGSGKQKRAGILKHRGARGGTWVIPHGNKEQGLREGLCWSLMSWFSCAEAKEGGGMLSSVGTVSRQS